MLSHLLDNIGAELLERQREDALKEARDQGPGELAHVEVKDVLNHIIAKGVLHERQRIHSHLRRKLGLLCWRGVINAALEHAAAMPMRGHLNAVPRDRVINELILLRRQLVETFLHDVIPVEILNEPHHVPVEGLDDNVDLVRCHHAVNQFLHRARPMHVHRHVHNAVGHRRRNEGPLLLIGVHKQLLAKVVSKRI